MRQIDYRNSKDGDLERIERIAKLPVKEMPASDLYDFASDHDKKLITCDGWPGVFELKFGELFSDGKFRYVEKEEADWWREHGAAYQAKLDSVVQ